MVSFSFLNAVDPTTIVFIVLLVLLIVALLVVPMFTNKKRAKQTDELHRSLKPGDLIKTVGGIIGTIKEIRQISPVDKEMVIETGEEGSKTTMVFDIQALYQVMSRANTTVAAEPEPENKYDEEEKRDVPPILADRANEAPAEEVAETAEPEQAEPAETVEQTETAAAAEEQPAEEPVVEVAEEPAAQEPAAKKSTSGAKKPAAKKSK